jgi:hypothetical protein
VKLIPVPDAYITHPAGDVVIILLKIDVILGITELGLFLCYKNENPKNIKVMEF